MRRAAALSAYGGAPRPPYRRHVSASTSMNAATARSNRANSRWSPLPEGVFFEPWAPYGTGSVASLAWVSTS